jgi:hypothetical protein
VLYSFAPPTTRDEMRAAALQYVRKVTGLANPSAEDLEVFEHAVGQIAEHTEELLMALHARTMVHTREGEKEKAKARWSRCEEQALAKQPRRKA